MENLLMSDGDLKIEVLENDVWRVVAFFFRQKIFIEKYFDCPNFKEKQPLSQTGGKSRLLCFRKKSAGG
ncbi:MAG: hypothetical protein ACKVUS_12620 [Saprospiraceae bacterium]